MEPVARDELADFPCGDWRNERRQALSIRFVHGRNRIRCNTHILRNPERRAGVEQQGLQFVSPILELPARIFRRANPPIPDMPAR